MRTNCIILFVLVTLMVLLSGPPACVAAEKEKEEKENIWLEEDKPKPGARRFELTDEVIKRIMDQLAESNPKEAEELRQLREKNPEKFKAELRERFGRRKVQRSDRKPRPGQDVRRPGPGPGGSGEPGGGPRAGGPGEPAVGPRPGGPGGGPGAMIRERVREQHAEYIEWLEENYPEEAEKLTELRESKPELYMRQIALSLKKYGRIAEAAKENPQLAEVLKESLQLTKQRDRLLRKIRSVTDEDEKKELAEKLKEVISSKFDLIVKRKQLAYERLRKELEKLQKEVKKNEAEAEKWKNPEFKDESVKARVEELMSRTSKFKWD